MTLKNLIRTAWAMAMVSLLLFVGILGIITEFSGIVKADFPFTSSVEISKDGASEAQGNPAIAADNTGNLYAAWEEDNGVDWDIFFTNSSDSGQTWKSPTVAVNSGGDDQTEPSIAVNPATGAIYVAWQDKSGGDWNISFANSTDGGISWTTPQVQINDDPGTERQGTPDIIVDSFGTIHAVWEDKRIGDWDIYHSKSTDGGNTWSANKKVSDTTTDQRYPTIAADLSGNLYVVYEDERVAALDNDIYFSKSTDGGLNWGASVKVSDALPGSSQEHPSIAVDSGGIIYVVWQDWRGVGADIYFSKSVNGGGAWSANTLVNDDTTNNQVHPDIAVGGGVLWVVWEDGKDGNLDIYFTNSTDQGVSFGADIQVNDENSALVSQQNPAIVYSPTQSIHVVWEDERGGDKDIYSSSLIPPVVSLTIDRFFISRSMDGSSNWVSGGSYDIDETDSFYAVGWNNSLNKFVSLVPVTWTVNPPTTGLVNPGSGVNTTFRALNIGTCKVRAAHGDLGSNETGILSIGASGIDRIIISLSSDGSTGWIGDQVYDISETPTFFACGWNDSVNQFVSLVSADWSSNQTSVGNVTTPGPSTTFTPVGDGICQVTASSIYGANNTGQLKVTSYNIDRIFISLSSGQASQWIGDRSYPEGESVTFYACGWNDTENVFVRLVEASWTSDNPSVGNVSPTGKSIAFNALSAGICKVTATNASLGSNQSGVLSVFALEVDEIIVSRSADKSGGQAVARSYSVEETDIFYAQGWNITYNRFLGLVDASWTSTDENVGTVTASGHWTNFTAGHVLADSTCTVSAQFLGITGTTGLLSVLTPRVDQLKIRTDSNNGGNVLDTATFYVNDTATFYAAGYNTTVDYIGDISGVAWSVSGLIGTVDPTFGNYTVFTATAAGTGKLKIVLSLDVFYESGTITVNETQDMQFPPNPPGQPTITVKGKDKIEITWPANAEPDIKNYVVQRAESDQGPWTTVVTLDNTTTSYSDSGLKAGTKYYYRITATNMNNLVSQPSPVVSATTKDKDNGDGGIPWILLILVIIIILVVVILLVLLMRKKGDQGGNGRYEI